MAVVAEDDEPISMRPVVLVGLVVAGIIGMLLVMMTLNDDTGGVHLPTNVSHHAATPAP